MPHRSGQDTDEKMKPRLTVVTALEALRVAGVFLRVYKGEAMDMRVVLAPTPKTL